MINTFVEKFCNPENPGQYDENVLYEAVDSLLAESRKSREAVIKTNITTVGAREKTHVLAIQALSLLGWRL